MSMLIQYMINFEDHELEPNDYNILYKSINDYQIKLFLSASIENWEKKLHGI